MGAVLTHVKTFPDDLEAFMEVLRDQPCFEGIVDLIEHQLKVRM